MHFDYTINNFTSALLSPMESFRTLCDIDFVERNSQSMPNFVRNTFVIDVHIKWRNCQYLLGMPLNPDAVENCRSAITQLAYFELHPFAKIEILENEMFVNPQHTEALRHCDMVLQKIPNHAIALSQIETINDPQPLLTAVEQLRQELQGLGLCHNNIKPSNCYYDGAKLHLINPYYATTNSGNDSAGFERLTTYIIQLPRCAKQECPTQYLYERDTEISSECIEIFASSDGMIRTHEASGWGFADSSHHYIIKPWLSYATDFRNGRACVKTQSGMGVIDKCGRFIVAPIYEVSDYIDTEDKILLRHHGLWAATDRNGKFLCNFGEIKNGFDWERAKN